VTRLCRRAADLRPGQHSNAAAVATSALTMAGR
jgi:hypothetical protein